MKFSRFASIVAIATWVVGSVAARADFFNGSFESGSYVFDGRGAASLAPGSTVIDGWTVIGGEVAVIQNTNTFGASTPFGDKLLDLTGYHDSAPYAGVQQSLATTIGQAYEISLYLGVNNSAPDGFAPVSVQVTAGSASAVLTADPSGPDNIWTLKTFTFTADATTTVVMIQGSSTANGHYIGLDNVSIVPSEVPEPTSLALLGAGGLVLLARALRRRANVRACSSRPMASTSMSAMISN